VLCPVSRPITTLDCVLLKDNNRALVAMSGPEINSQASVCILQGLCHNTRCWFSIQRFIFLLIFCLETLKKGSGPTKLWTESSLASLSAISFPRTPTCSETQYSPTVCRIDISGTVYQERRCFGSLKRFEIRLCDDATAGQIARGSREFLCTWQHVWIVEKWEEALAAVIG
jgi:hypothetical protein